MSEPLKLDGITLSITMTNLLWPWVEVSKRLAGIALMAIDNKIDASIDNKEDKLGSLLSIMDMLAKARSSMKGN